MEHQIVYKNMQIKDEIIISKKENKNNYFVKICSNIDK